MSPRRGQAAPRCPNHSRRCPPGGRRGPSCQGGAPTTPSLCELSLFRPVTFRFRTRSFSSCFFGFWLSALKTKASKWELEPSTRNGVLWCPHSNRKGYSTLNKNHPSKMGCCWSQNRNWNSARPHVVWSCKIRPSWALVCRDMGIGAKYLPRAWPALSNLKPKRAVLSARALGGGTCSQSGFGKMGLFVFPQNSYVFCLPTPKRGAILGTVPSKTSSPPPHVSCLKSQAVSICGLFRLPFPPPWHQQNPSGFPPAPVPPPQNGHQLASPRRALPESFGAPGVGIHLEGARGAAGALQAAPAHRLVHEEAYATSTASAHMWRPWLGLGGWVEGFPLTYQKKACHATSTEV